MFFTSGIIIAFFCFSFYLIWNQFLKKDTRLSTGLQVLRKKITDLENLSLTVEAQVDRHMSIVNERTRRLELLAQKTKTLCEQLEKNIKIAHSKKKYDISSLNKKVTKEESHSSSIKTSPNVEELKNKDASSGLASSHLKMVKEQPSSNKQRQFQFGKSPFTDLDFMESP